MSLNKQPSYIAIEKTHQRILTEAAHLFVASGYHGVSMREVAEAVGVTKPALYHHFADKEALFLAVLQGALKALGRIIDVSSKQDGIHEQLKVLVDELIDTAPEHRVGLQLSGELRHISPERRAAFESEYRKVWMGGLSSLIEQAINAGQLRSDIPAVVQTRAFLALILPIISSSQLSQSKETASALLSLYLHGAVAKNA